MAIPQFERLGSKVNETTLGRGMFNPWLIDNDALRANLPGLPATRFSVLFSTDHATGANPGRWYRADFDDIEGSWTYSPTEIYSAANQRETPAPVYDEVNNRILLLAHDSDSNGQPYNDQHAVLLSTTNLSTFTDVDANPLNYGNHTGYAQLMHDAARGEYLANTILNAGEYNLQGIGIADAGLDFELQGHFAPHANHVLGTGNTGHGSGSLFQFEGEWYLAEKLTARPRFTPANSVSLVCYPVYWQWGKPPRPKGGYYTLIAKGSELTDPDNQWIESPRVFDIDGTLYMICTGQTSAGVNNIMLYKATATPASYTAPAVPINGNGLLKNPGKETVVFDWDAANDAVPGGITIAAASGSNGSSQSAGNHYELSTGSGSSQTLTASIGATVNPTAHEVVEFSIHDLTLRPTFLSQTNIQFALIDSWTTGLDGLILSTTTTYDGMGLYVYKANSNIAVYDSYAMGYNEADGTVAAWLRSYPMKLTMRLQDFGTKLLVLFDDQVHHYKDLTGYALAWNAATFAGIRLLSTASPWGANYVRFSRLKLSTYNENAAAPPGIGSPFVRVVA